MNTECSECQILFSHGEFESKLAKRLSLQRPTGSQVNLAGKVCQLVKTDTTDICRDEFVIGQ